MYLEVLARRIVTLQQLILDVGLTGCRDQGRRPILSGEDFVDLGPGRHQSRPANHRRDAISTFPVGILLALEGRRPAVGPRERLGAIVGGVDHDGVVGDTEVVELFQQLPDLAVMFDHAVWIDAKTRSALGFYLEPGPDVHTARIEPDEE